MPSKIQWLNGLLCVLLFLNLTGTFVSFGGVLIKANAEGYGTVRLYYDRLEGPGLSMPYADAPNSLGGACKHPGRGMVAMMVFALFSLVVQSVAAALRLTGRDFGSEKLRNMPLFMRMTYELYASFVSILFIFLGVTIFGGGCFSQVKSAIDLNNVRATGFVYLVFCLFFAIGASGLLVYLRKHEHTSYHVGGREHTRPLADDDYTNYNHNYAPASNSAPSSSSHHVHIDSDGL